MASDCDCVSDCADPEDEADSPVLLPAAAQPARIEAAVRIPVTITIFFRNIILFLPKLRAEFNGQD